MIERIYLKNHLSFDEVELVFGEVELNLSKGLMILELKQMMRLYLR